MNFKVEVSINIEGVNRWYDGTVEEAKYENGKRLLKVRPLTQQNSFGRNTQDKTPPAMTVWTDFIVNKELHTTRMVSSDKPSPRPFRRRVARHVTPTPETISGETRSQWCSDLLINTVCGNKLPRVPSSWFGCKRDPSVDLFLH